jgi:hypothetical protein
MSLPGAEILAHATESEQPNIRRQREMSRRKSSADMSAAAPRDAVAPQVAPHVHAYRSPDANKPLPTRGFRVELKGITRVS